MRLPYIKNTIPVVFNASFFLGIASIFYFLAGISNIIYLAGNYYSPNCYLEKLCCFSDWCSHALCFLLHLVFPTGDILLEESYVLFDSLSIDIAPVFISDIVDMIVSLILLSITIISVFGVAGRLTERNINPSKESNNYIVLCCCYIFSFCFYFLNH